MATVIKLKRGTQTPTTSDIIDGEVAIDTSSQRLFARSGSDILQIGKDNFSDLTVSGTVIFEGSTADSFETTLQVTDPTADRTLTLPDKSGTLATTDDLAAGTDTLSDVTGRGATTSDAITINNDLTVNGDTILGDATSDNITFNGRISSNFVPAADNTYSLGTSSLKWSELHVSGSTIFLGNAQIQASATKVVLPLESQLKTSTGANVRIAEANAGGIPIRNVPLFTKSGGLSTASTEFTFTAEIRFRKNYNGTFTLANGTQTAVNTDITLFEF